MYLTEEEIRNVLNCQSLPPSLKIPGWKLAKLPEILATFKWQLDVPSHTVPATRNRTFRVKGRREFFTTKRAAEARFQELKAKGVYGDDGKGRTYYVKPFPPKLPAVVAS